MGGKHPAARWAAALAAALLSCNPPYQPPRPPPIPPWTLRPPPLAVAPQAPTAAPSVSSTAPVTPQPHRFAVAAENKSAAQVALATLERGGSAADAAIAAMLAAGVTQAVSSGPGGGGIALYWDAPKKTATVVDFRETAPIGIRPGDYTKRPAPPKKRGAMVGIPGEVAGMGLIHQRWGKLPWAELVAPAIELADKGFVISPHMARALVWRKSWVLSNARGKAVFAPQGRLARSGETVRNPALAATLRSLATNGAQSFYQGSVAKDIMATAASAGGRMILSDMSGYRAIERKALATSWAGKRILTAPPPSAGGLLLLETLNMHSPDALEALGFGSGPYVHVLAETFRGAIADRLRVVGDPAYYRASMAPYYAPGRMKARRARILLNRTHKPESFPLHEKGTSHLVMVDEQGNVMSVTSSVRSMFGARLMTQGGFVLNDQLVDFTTGRLERRYRARHQPNTPRGGARPVTSMTPTLVLDGDKVVLALGASGGARIPGAVTQALIAKLVFGRSVSEAVAEPRLVAPAAGGLLLTPGTPAALLEDLRRRGEVVRADRPDFSSVQMISIGQASGVRRLEAAADPRKAGSALLR